MPSSEDFFGATAFVIGGILSQPYYYKIVLAVRAVLEQWGIVS